MDFRNPDAAPDAIITALVGPGMQSNNPALVPKIASSGMVILLIELRGAN
jgi:hypothetical protein